LRQESLKSELALRRFNVVGSVSTLSNAVFVVATADRVNELESLPGVRGVIPMRALRGRMNRAVQLMNAPAAWNLIPGGMNQAGAGIKIAILDSGIDQTHPAFQDSSLQIPAGFPICTNNHPEDCAYTNSKVIVARSYVRLMAAGTDPANVAANSLPDDYSPRDREGHGTAVASVAAANQNSGALTFSGMAPKAFLGNYKISGSPTVLGNGSVATFEDIAVMAINDAFNDGMDIANFSSGVIAVTGPLDTGAACGLAADVPCDFIAWNFDKAARAGMVITVSAGNDGDSSARQYPSFNLISSPSNAPSVISVGATLNSHVLEPGVSIVKGPASLQSIAAQTSDLFAFFTTPFSGPLVDVTQLGDDGTACKALAANSLLNAIALIQRSPTPSACSFSDQAFNASDAGAFGVVFYMADSSAPIPAEVQDSFGNFPSLGPVVVVAQSDGQALKSYIDANPGGTVLVDPAGSEMDISAYNKLWNFSPPLAPNQVLAFSSPGPDAGDLAIKPDLVAVGGANQNNNPSFADGTTLVGQSGLFMAAQSFDYSGAVYSATGYAAANGTSFSAPMVAGAAALIKQLHPKMTAGQIKAILMNSAAQDTISDEFGNAVDVISVGAGRLDAGAAAAATVAVSVGTTDGSNPVSLSFGALKSGMLPITKQVLITNFGASSVSLNIGVAPNQKTSLATLAVDQPSATVPAGGSLKVNVTLSGSLPGTGEYSGALTVQGTGISLRLPYMFLVPIGGVSSYDVLPFTSFLQAATFFPCLEGLPGQDAGYVAARFIDATGAPLVGTPVTFTVARGNGTTLGNAPVESVGYKTTACTVASSGVSSACQTDQYGIAYAEVLLSSQVGASPSITARGAGASFVFGGSSCAPAVIAKPSVASITDASSGGSSAVAGSYIAIKGTSLANPAFISAPDGNGDYAQFPPLPLGLDGVNASFDVPGSYDGKRIDYNGQPGPVAFVGIDAGTVLVQVPWELQGASSVQVKVTVDGFAPSNVITVPLVQYAPSVFSNPDGSGIAFAYDVTTQSEVTTSNPAHAGDTVELFANGLGPVNNQPASGGNLPAAPTFTGVSGQPGTVTFSGKEATTTNTPTVTVGGQPATVTFSGLDYSLADSPYWFQYGVIVQIPAVLTAGNQPVVLSIGGLTASPLPIPLK
jgi:uncharacterized protein (TIGR03437 family)